MARKKRTPAQRDLDLPWIAAQAEQGLSPTAIIRKARQEGRDSVAQLTRQQVWYDLRQLRDAALREGSKTYGKVLERTIQELCRLAFSDFRALAEWNGSGLRVRPSMDLSQAEAATVAGVSFRKTRKTNDDGQTEVTVDVDIKTHSKNQALRDLLRHLGGFVTIEANMEADDSLPAIASLVQRLSQASEAGTGES